MKGVNSGPQKRKDFCFNPRVKKSFNSMHAE